MDALELLKEDHERVKRLFDQFRTTTGFQGRKQIFMNIFEELDTHTYVEETIFYPSFRNFPEFSEILKESYEDHAKVKETLNSIFSELNDGGQPDDFVAKVEALENDVMSHVHEEENELFPKVRHQMKRGERETLGRHLQAAKDERREQAA